MASVIPYEFGVDYPFEDIFPDPSPFAGVKAVWGPMQFRYLCFGAGGASHAAGLASKTPWAICIGASKVLNPANKGRVINLVRLTTSHQASKKFFTTPAEEEVYAQWPDAVALADVFEVVGSPHVIDDLGLTVHPLLQAYDKVADLTPERLPIVAALRGWKVRLVDLPPLPAAVTLGTVVPSAIGAEEGREIMRLVMLYERNAKLSKLVKAANKHANGGFCVCEGCGFRDAHVGLFDAHHRIPVHYKVQSTTPAMLAVLCPTCHRVVHRLAHEPHLPLTIAALRAWHAGRSC